MNTEIFFKNIFFYISETKKICEQLHLDECYMYEMYTPLLQVNIYY